MRRDWTKDYREAAGEGGGKRYIYTGVRHALLPESRRVYQSRVIPCVMFLLAAQAGWGLIDTPASRVMYVALPWAAVTSAAAFSLFDLTRILMVRRALTERDYASSALRLKRTLGVSLAFSALQIAADLVHLVQTGFPGAILPPFSFHLVALGLSILAWRLEKQAVWKTILPAD